MASFQEVAGVSPNGAGRAKLRLGGMALRNGLLVHGPGHWAVAVRTRAGDIKVASGAKPRVQGAAAEVVGLRGVVRLGEALALIPLVKRRVPEVKLPFEDVKLGAAMAGSSLLGALLRRSGPRSVVRETVIAVLGFAPTAFALKDSDLAAYHGVEHKAIAGYERDTDAAEAAKEHERCGSNLILPMMLSTIAGNALLRLLRGTVGPLESAAVTLVAVAGAVELLAWSERHHGSPLARAVKLPGTEMQRLFATREPTSEQLEVGRAALAEILRVEPPPA
jgi:uncharacterized protein YqhQ